MISYEEVAKRSPEVSQMQELNEAGGRELQLQPIWNI